MLSVKVDNSQFKAMAKRFREQCSLRGIAMNNQSALQIVAHTLLGKPYEEIKATLLDTATPAEQAPYSVCVLHYGSESLLLLNGNYITGCYPGTDLEIPLRTLLDQGHTLAAQHNTVLKEVHLPAILAPDFETDDMIRLAERMGELKPHPSIFDCFEMVDSGKKTVLIDDNKGVYSLNGDYLGELETAAENDGDYLGELETAAENDEDPFSVTVWMPEYYDNEGQFFEFFVSFAELCDATTNDNGQTWSVPNGKDHFLKIRFV